MKRLASLKPKLRAPFAKLKRSRAAEQESSIVHAPDAPLMRSMNLLPANRRAESRRIALNPVHAALVVLVPLAALGIGALYFAESQAAGDAAAERDAVASEVATLQQEVAVAGAGQALDAVATAELPEISTAIAGGLSERISWDRVLDSVRRLRTDRTWYTSIAGGNAVGEGDAPAEVSGDVRLEGATESGHDAVAQLVSRLERSREFSDVLLETSTHVQIGEQQVTQFSIIANVRGPR
jgi:hypothetical protein